MTTPRIGTTYAISDRTVTRFDGTMFSPMAFGTVQRWSVLVDGKLVRSGLRSKGAATTFARRWQRNVIDPRPVPVQPTPAPATHIIRAWDNTVAGETPLCGAARSLNCTIWPDACEKEQGLTICPACRKVDAISAEEDAREARKDAMAESDPRYEYVICATCQGQFQRIDFRGALHIALCEKPVEPALVADERASAIEVCRHRLDSCAQAHAALRQAALTLTAAGVPCQEDMERLWAAVTAQRDVAEGDAIVAGVWTEV